MSDLETLRQQSILALEVLGTAAFAFSGVLGAVRQRMDVVGIVVCGFLTAFGGGTLRDVLLDRRPFFWVEHQGVLLLVLALCLGFATFLKRAHLECGQRWLDIPDAIGLGLFAATGVQLSWALGQPAAVAIMMGVITGTFGGVLRDMVGNEIPTLFRDHRPYALCAAAGGLAFVLLASVGAPESVALGVCALLITVLRGLVLWLDYRLPSLGR